MKIPQGNNLIVFTDLDGTLLDHGSYSFDAALEALELLKRHQIPLIIASSKTRSEVEVIQGALGFGNCEAIVENGAGLFLPGDDDISTDYVYDDLLRKIAQIPSKYSSKFKGFSQWDVKEISSVTGLGQHDAERAKDRQFSEPGIWLGSDEEFAGFRDCLNDQGIFMQVGGRFLTLSFGSQKAGLMQTVIDRHSAGNIVPFSIALGDAPNDVAMLETADHGIIVPNPSHDGIGKLPGENTGNIIRAPYPGPRGWNAAVLEVLQNAGLGA